MTDPKSVTTVTAPVTTAAAESSDAGKHSRGGQRRTLRSKHEPQGAGKPQPLAAVRVKAVADNNTRENRIH